MAFYWIFQCQRPDIDRSCKLWVTWKIPSDYWGSDLFVHPNGKMTFYFRIILYIYILLLVSLEVKCPPSMPRPKGPKEDMKKNTEACDMWHTPLKINMEPKNHLVEKEHHFPNLHYCVPCVPGCTRLSQDKTTATNLTLPRLACADVETAWHFCRWDLGWDKRLPSLKLT